MKARGDSFVVFSVVVVIITLIWVLGIIQLVGYVSNVGLKNIVARVWEGGSR